MYLLVTVLLILTVDQSAIAISKTPLLLIFERADVQWILRIFSLIAIIAITNTGLINLIMASRLLYGMSSEGLLPAAIGAAHQRRQTPWVGVLIGFAAVLLLVFTGGLQVLAQTSSFLILFIFCLVHISLIRIKHRREEHAGVQFPIAFPWLGALICGGLLFFYPLAVYLRSLIVVGIGLLIWFLQRR